MISIPNYTLQNCEGKRVMLKSRSTKQNDRDKNHRKKLFSGLQSLIDESADSRLNWNEIVSNLIAHVDSC